MTLVELAELCGTSVATVSKAFSGSREISNETKERIFAIAKQNNCFDKYYKGPREKNIFALIFPESESEFYGREIGFLEKAINSRGADTVIALTRFDPEREERLFRELVYRMRVDAVVISGKASLIKNPDEVPLVIIGEAKLDEKQADNVRSEFSNCICELIGLVKEYGHREVGFIGERYTNSKLDIFKRALRHHGLPVRKTNIAVSDARFAAAGEEGMRELIRRGTVPSVIVTAYDQIAYGAMSYAKEQGYRIPEDVSFVGMDDLSSTDYVNVPLTSVHVHLEDTCEEIVDLLFKKIENRRYRGRKEIRIPVSVSLRKSLCRRSGDEKSGYVKKPKKE